MTIACPEARRMLQQQARQFCSASDKNGQTPRGMGTFEVCRGVADHPNRVVRGNSRAIQGAENRVWCRLVALAVPGPDGAGNPALPAQMGQLGAQVVAHLVAYNRDIAAPLRAALQQRGGAGQRLQALQMDAIESFVEYPLGLGGARSKQAGKQIAQRAVGTVAHLIGRPRHQPEGRERVAIAFDDGRPGIHQRVVPVEQDSARWLEARRQPHVTASPEAANRTYSSRSRRAVDPTLPLPTASPSIFTTGVTKEVALVMKASLAFLASDSVNGRSTILSCKSLASVFNVSRVMPARMPGSVWRVTSSLFWVTIQALVEAPSVTRPSRSTSQAS